MTLTEIRKRVASNIGYVDSSGDVLTGKNITSTDIDNWINDRYLDDLLITLATQYPEDYERIAKTTFYKAAGTIATISDTTLTSSDITFDTSMTGDRIYNSTQGNYEEIDSRTSSSEIELDAAQSSWEVGDTIYVLGHQFAIGGDATDLRHIRQVSVKYNSDDAYYKTCNYKDHNDLFKTGNETYSESNPVWYITSCSVAGVLTTVLGILPEASENVSDGIRIRYVEVQPAMSADSDIPRLPVGSHSILVKGTTADAFRKMLMFDKAKDWESLYQKARSEMVTEYALTRSSTPPRVLPPRKNRWMLDRIR